MEKECKKDPMICEYSEFIEWKCQGKIEKAIFCWLHTERKEKEIVIKLCPHPCRRWR
jgi:hypothetical protein